MESVWDNASFPRSARVCLTTGDSAAGLQLGCVVYCEEESALFAYFVEDQLRGPRQSRGRALCTPYTYEDVPHSHNGKSHACMKCRTCFGQRTRCWTGRASP